MAPASEMAFHVELGLWGIYNLCAVGARRVGGKPTTREPGARSRGRIQLKIARSTAIRLLQGIYISQRSEEGRTEMWPLRAVGLVSGLWRCDERLLWHLFAPGPSCLGQFECRCGPFVREQTQSQALCRFLILSIAARTARAFEVPANLRCSLRMLHKSK
jgi:hypothetical protein